MKRNPYGVEVGQVWKSCDPRDISGFKLVVAVMDVGPGYAIVRSCHPDGSHPGNRSRIRLDRFKPGSRGYELVGKAKR